LINKTRSQNLKKINYSVFGIPLLIVITISFISCKSNTEPVNKPSIELVATYPLQIEQPSGIAFNKDYTSFWIIDGKYEKIFKTDLNGHVLESLSYVGNDLEGICFDGDSSLWIVEEELREIIQLDLSGKILQRFKTNLSGTFNNGFEGITIGEQNSLFVINEKQPKAIYAFDKNISSSKKYEVDFAEDLSDICYNSTTKNFFITSDESKAVFVWNTANGLIDKFNLPFTKFEGIAINPLKNKIVVVNDSLNVLYEYELMVR